MEKKVRQRASHHPSHPVFCGSPCNRWCWRQSPCGIITSWCQSGPRQDEHRFLLFSETGETLLGTAAHICRSRMSPWIIEATCELHVAIWDSHGLSPMPHWSGTRLWKIFSWSNFSRQVCATCVYTHRLLPGSESPREAGTIIVPRPHISHLRLEGRRFRNISNVTQLISGNRVSIPGHILKYIFLSALHAGRPYPGTKDRGAWSQVTTCPITLILVLSMFSACTHVYHTNTVCLRFYSKKMPPSWLSRDACAAFPTCSVLALSELGLAGPMLSSV